MVIILTGPSGCGKTTVGEALARKLDWDIYDADDFHSKKNIEKMTNGIPLSDEDRKPWLLSLSREIKKWNQGRGNAILACSALKRSYREILGVDQRRVKTVFLKGSYDLLKERLKKRDNHYMSPELLQSQLDALEEPQSGLTVSIDQTPERIAASIILSLRLSQATKRRLCNSPQK